MRSYITVQKDLKQIGHEDRRKGNRNENFAVKEDKRERNSSGKTNMIMVIDTNIKLLKD